MLFIIIIIIFSDFPRLLRIHVTVVFNNNTNKIHLSIDIYEFDEFDVS